jgi:hypothetical protein
VLARVLADLIDWDEAGMIQQGNGLGFVAIRRNSSSPTSRPALIIFSATWRLRETYRAS